MKPYFLLLTVLMVHDLVTGSREFRITGRQHCDVVKMMVCQPFDVVLGVEPGIHDHYLFGIGRSFFGYGADDFLECSSVLAVTFVDSCSYKQPLCIHHRDENHDLAVVAFSFTAAEPAQVRVFHSALKVGIGDVKKKYFLLQLEHVAYALVEPSSSSR